MISFENQLLNLKRKNSNLKSRLHHIQLKHENYSYKYLERDMALVLERYEQNRSLVKSASDLNLDKRTVLKWYFEGQKGNPAFKSFSQKINSINGSDGNSSEIEFADDACDENEYEIIKTENNWIYTCILDGEKHSLISNDLERLKQKVRDSDLPITEF